jgi:nitrogen regulatory protein PII
LEAGDYITTSNVAGYGQKQESDSLKNYTVAKITMDCDFNPATQPIQIIKKDEEGENVLDEHGQIQWEDHATETEKAYKIRYLDTDGNITDEANAVHTAAFVGCTYHCG